MSNVYLVPNRDRRADESARDYAKSVEWLVCCAKCVGGVDAMPISGAMDVTCDACGADVHGNKDNTIKIPKFNSSKGSLGLYFDEVSRQWIEYHVNGSEVYRAPISNVLDCRTGYRIARWECSLATFEANRNTTFLHVEVSR